MVGAANFLVRPKEAKAGTILQIDRQPYALRITVTISHALIDTHTLSKSKQGD